jgi:alkaline phosphatase D
MMTRFKFFLTLLLGVTGGSVALAALYLGQGTMSGEVTDSSVFLQTRLTATTDFEIDGDLAGAAGVVRFEWSRQEDFSDSVLTRWQVATAEHDFIARAELVNLEANTRYFYRVWYGANGEESQKGATCSFKTLAGSEVATNVRFIVGSCMNYNKFMHGKVGNAGPVITATAEDKRLGFPAFAAMRKLRPDFFVGTGDIVYYDNPYRVAETLEELRACWHEQFRFPRMIEFFEDVPTYWSKDDHDFRFNDSDNATNRLPLPSTGIELFREQMPMMAMSDRDTPTYRTHRVSKDLQVWITEGRDYRSANESPDGPEKTLWGAVQLEWLQRTLKASDAKWKILITPTPMVGPDVTDGPDAKRLSKLDNHVSLGGFRHEADAFFAWLKENEIENFVTICGDRHWQYHSIHPSGIEEFAVGALNDENARLGVLPGAKDGTDPDGLVVQPYTASKPYGGFLQVTAGESLVFDFYAATGEKLYSVTK